MTTKLPKKQTLRNNEYYDTQDIFDELYYKAKNKPNYRFTKLMELIKSKENIELAYRNIKKNTGSTTCGTNGKTIKDFSIRSNDEVVKYIRSRLENFNPHMVRRVEISKPNGDKRPLGIPTIEDRIVQQCIKQVLEPICEAKFYNHSYGFRPNRSAHHAKERAMSLANVNKLHYVVDIDIKGFFDNVNHSKLLKQMWTLGIQDKQVISVISKMLKSPIEGEGIPTKGTPQGGILSPLLSNIVLNELDWWIANQWEYFNTKHNYEKVRQVIDKKTKEIKKTYIDRSHKYRAMRSTSLKEIFIVRYADDFKIFCRDYKTAQKINTATRLWLKERLDLEVSNEKSKIVNLKKNYSEFLGFKIKIYNKGKKQVIRSHMSEKAKKEVKRKLRSQIKKISKTADYKEVANYNSMILGMHNYYKVATRVNEDFARIAFDVNKSIYNRTRKISTYYGIKTQCFKRFYGEYNFKTVFINGIPLYPINGVKNSPSSNFNQDICNYTRAGREEIHKKQSSVSYRILRHLMDNPVKERSIEYNDNRISLYVAQKGMCPISNELLEIGNMECHHKKPQELGGNDEYSNLIFLKTEVHILIHAKDKVIIKKYLEILNLDEKALKKVNKLRKLVGNSEI